MTIREKSEESQRIIDLTGPQGNAYCLLGIAQRAAKQLGMDHTGILAEMKESDYEHLVETFDKYFGEIFILER